MKQTTNDWLLAAEDDLLAAQKLVTEAKLTNVVAFHCQQWLEKCFKAVIEEKGLSPLKSHDLIRLQQNATVQILEPELILLATINECISMPAIREIWDFYLRENQQSLKQKDLSYLVSNFLIESKNQYNYSTVCIRWCAIASRSRDPFCLKLSAYCLFNFKYFRHSMNSRHSIKKHSKI